MILSSHSYSIKLLLFYLSDCMKYWNTIMLSCKMDYVFFLDQTASLLDAIFSGKLFWSTTLFVVYLLRWLLWIMESIIISLMWPKNTKKYQLCSLPNKSNFAMGLSTSFVKHGNVWLFGNQDSRKTCKK